MDADAAVRRLRVTATLLVALAFGAGGIARLVRPDPSVTMLSRYLDTAKAARAAGCMELALALWLTSGRSPKLGPTVAAAVLGLMALGIAGELRRDHPLPSGTGVARAVSQDRSVVRSELSVALGRDVFLIGLCVLSGTLAGPGLTPSPGTPGEGWGEGLPSSRKSRPSP